MIVILAEKPDIGTRLAASMGGCYINGIELKSDMVTDKKYTSLIKRERASKGYLECKLFNKKCIVTWVYGHLVELKQAKDYSDKYKNWNLNNFPFIPNNFETKIKQDNNIKQHFLLVQKLFNDPKTEYIINATDSDREGDLIFAYIYEYAKTKKPYKRLWINSYTDESIEEGMKHLKNSREMQTTIEAGKCRAISDWLIGNNFTVLATLKYGGYKNLISLGRVQTPTLAILVQREIEIKNFKKEKFYELNCTFNTKNNETYKGKIKNKFSSKGEIDKIIKDIKNEKATIDSYNHRENIEKPPLLYDLTALQMDANKKYGFSPKETVSIVQKLYENQILTYPRTNSRYLKLDMRSQTERLLGSLQPQYKKFAQRILIKPLKYSERVFNDSKVEGHTAIMTTYKTPKSLTDNEQKIYNLVAESLLKAFMSNAIWFSVEVKTRVKNNIFISRGKTLVEKGWREIDNKEITNVLLIPQLKKGELVSITKYDNTEKVTKPPSRITDYNILTFMECAGKYIEDETLREAIKEHGIGTVATRADIIEKLIKVKYAERKGKNLIPTQKGIDVIEKIPIEEIKSPKLTGEWEYKLSQIEKGKISSEEFLKDIKQYVLDISQKLKSQPKQELQSDIKGLGKCPICGKPVTKNKKGWGCSDWRNGCNFQIWDNKICEKHLTEANIKQLLEKNITRTIKNFISKKGKKFDAKLELIYKNNKYLIEFNFK